MQCPSCGTPLTMSERHGIEIDYCPSCRGVWLDRGELDKIIDRIGAQQPQPTPMAPHAPQDPHWRGHGDPGHGYPKRRKSFLEELFD